MSKPADVPVVTWARPMPALCVSLPHRWYPLRGSETKASGVRSLCLRCGAVQPSARREAVALGVVRVTVRVRGLG